MSLTWLVKSFVLSLTADVAVQLLCCSPPRGRTTVSTRASQGAVVGVAEHCNSAELITVASHGELRDRRRIDLTSGLPTHPYHHEGSWAVGRYANSPWAKQISLTDAIALVE